MAEDFRERLIVFTRYPEAGTTKTRMIPKLGAQGAAELQRQMTEHIISRAKELCKLQALPVEIRYEGGSEKLMTEWLGPGFYYSHQGSGDIGLRMARALQDAFRQGCETAVIIGSDIPDITTNIMAVMPTNAYLLDSASRAPINLDFDTSRGVLLRCELSTTISFCSPLCWVKYLMKR